MPIVPMGRRLHQKNRSCCQTSPKRADHLWARGILYFIERVDYLRVDAHNPTQGGLCNSQELTREGLCNQVVWGGCVGGLCNLICSRENKENTGAASGRTPQGRCAPLWLCFL